MHSTASTLPTQNLLLPSTTPSAAGALPCAVVASALPHAQPMPMGTAASACTLGTVSKARGVKVRKQEPARLPTRRKAEQGQGG